MAGRIKKRLTGVVIAPPGEYAHLGLASGFHIRTAADAGTGSGVVVHVKTQIDVGLPAVVPGRFIVLDLGSGDLVVE